MDGIREKLIEHDLECLDQYQGVNDSVYYEGLANSIMDLYSIKQPERVKPREDLGIRVLAVFDDHGLIRLSDLEKGVQANPDFVLFGGDHSQYTIERVAEATEGIRKYALLGNHDGSIVESTFKKVGAKNIHGSIIETSEGLIIGGMQGSHIYNENRKGRTFLTHYESMQVAKSMIHELRRRQIGMDIFFSHDHAFTQRYDPSLVYNDGCSHVGLLGITWLTYYNDEMKMIYPVQYHVHGHLHISEQIKNQFGQVRRSVYGVELLSL